MNMPDSLFWFHYVPLVRTAYRMGRCGITNDCGYHLQYFFAGMFLRMYSNIYILLYLLSSLNGIFTFL
jgi:hypothetical protein